MDRFYSDFEKLSLREKQIATLMSEGCSAEELQNRLHLNQDSLGQMSKKMMTKLSHESIEDFKLFLQWVKKHIG